MEGKSLLILSQFIAGDNVGIRAGQDGVDGGVDGLYCFQAT